MSAASDVVSYLASIGVFTAGVDAFVGTEPDLPTASLTTTIYDTGGAPTEHWYLYEDPTIQVRVRASSYEVGHAKAEQIRVTLTGIRTLVYDGYHYTGFWIISDIAKIGRDDRDREIFTFNLRIMREPDNGTT